MIEKEPDDPKSLNAEADRDLSVIALKCLQKEPSQRYATAAEMADCGFVNSVVPRDQLEAEVRKYAEACAGNRSTDVIFIQKTFFEIMKQSQNEYMGSLISAMLESLATYGKSDTKAAAAGDTKDVIAKGLTTAVKDFDSRFPPEWRLSRKGRAQAE